MLPLNNLGLPPKTSQSLAKYQSLVDLEPTFAEQVSKGKLLFKKFNVKTNPTFKDIRSQLTIMSGGTVRCNYCEDSAANQVEHIYPKNYYPEKCFIWNNYCYACGPCNQPKFDQFSIFQNSNGNEINLKSLPQNSNPPLGLPLLIDPRTEDPTTLLFLDTNDTFHYVPFSQEANEIRRAEYTINLLGLNTRSYLVRSRKNAFIGFRARLVDYIEKRNQGVPPSILDGLIDSIKSEHNQTVWFEIKRQRRLHPDIDNLLNDAPEALTW